MKGKLYVSASGSETFHAVQQMVSKISRKLYIYIYIYIYICWSWKVVINHATDLRHCVF